MIRLALVEHCKPANVLVRMKLETLVIALICLGTVSGRRP